MCWFAAPPAAPSLAGVRRRGSVCEAACPTGYRCAEASRIRVSHAARAAVRERPPHSGGAADRRSRMSSRGKPLSEDERAERRRADREFACRAVEQLQSSEGWQRWLATRARFHCYSLANQLLIAMQRVVSQCLLGRGWMDIRSSGVQCRRAGCDRRGWPVRGGALLGVVGPFVTRACRCWHGVWPPDFRSRAGCVWGGTGAATGGPESGGS